MEALGKILMVGAYALVLFPFVAGLITIFIKTWFDYKLILSKAIADLILQYLIPKAKK